LQRVTVLAQFLSPRLPIDSGGKATVSADFVQGKPRGPVWRSALYAGVPEPSYLGSASEKETAPAGAGAVGKDESMKKAS